MERLIKVHDLDCPICSNLDGFDRSLAEDKGYLFQKLGLPALSYMKDHPLYSYIIENYVKEGAIDIPLYIITTDGVPTASGVVNSLDELKNLLEAWENFSDAT